METRPSPVQIIPTDSKGRHSPNFAQPSQSCETSKKSSSTRADKARLGAGALGPISFKEGPATAPRPGQFVRSNAADCRSFPTGSTPAAAPGRSRRGGRLAPTRPQLPPAGRCPSGRTRGARTSARNSAGIAATAGRRSPPRHRPAPHQGHVENEVGLGIARIRFDHRSECPPRDRRSPQPPPCAPHYRFPITSPPCQQGSFPIPTPAPRPTFARTTQPGPASQH